MADPYEIAAGFLDEYKRWLIRTNLASSAHNARTFLHYTVSKWREQWGHILTDNIAKALHSDAIK